MGGYLADVPAVSVHPGRDEMPAPCGDHPRSLPLYGDAQETVLESYAAYHSLGGNGTITKMVEELKQLPTLRE